MAGSRLAVSGNRNVESDFSSSVASRRPSTLIGRARHQTRFRRERNGRSRRQIGRTRSFRASAICSIGNCIERRSLCPISRPALAHWRSQRPQIQCDRPFSRLVCEIGRRPIGAGAVPSAFSSSQTAGAPVSLVGFILVILFLLLLLGGLGGGSVLPYWGYGYGYGHGGIGVILIVVAVLALMGRL